MTKKILYRWKTVAGRRVRGKRVATFERYKHLLLEARTRAQAAGYPKSEWHELFDWAEGE